jgi:DNA-binding CsgD family transcriptional regulator
VSAFALSARELEVARALARRESLGQIAQRLGITPQNVSATIVRAKNKLGLFNRFQLAAYAKEAGW